MTYIAKQHGYETDIVLAGRNLNDGMSNWIIKQIKLEANLKNIKIASAKILLLGLTFKENCPDIRNSKVLDIIKILNDEDQIPYIYDPFLIDKKSLSDISFRYLTQSPLDQCDKYEIIIVSTAHDEFKNIDSKDWKKILKENYIIYDLKGIIPRDLNPLRI